MVSVCHVLKLFLIVKDALMEILVRFAMRTLLHSNLVNAQNVNMDGKKLQDCKHSILARTVSAMMIMASKNM
jgi:hypothetical protein